MGDLIGKVLDDPWVVTLIIWAVRLFLLCLLTGFVLLIYRLTIGKIMKFPYPDTKPAPGLGGWVQSLRQRLKRVKLTLPGAEVEFEERLPERFDPAIHPHLETKDAIIKELEKELEEYRSLISEMRKRLANHEQKGAEQ